MLIADQAMSMFFCDKYAKLNFGAILNARKIGTLPKDIYPI